VGQPDEEPACLATLVMKSVVDARPCPLI